MGLFDFFKKNKKENENTTRFEVIVKAGTNPTTKPDVDWEHLTDEGELPVGWTYHNKEFTDRINNEFSYFLHLWLDSRNKSPRELRAALKSFVLYLEDIERICKSKGECFEFYFREIIASQDYIQERKEELSELENNIESLQEAYDRKKQNLIGLEEKIVQKLIENDGILQADFIRLFDPSIKNEVSEKLYYWDKGGKITRQKSGRSYILHFRG